VGCATIIKRALRTLKLEDVAKIKDAFIRNKAPRFMKYFFPHMPYGKQKQYVAKLEKASLERLARLIKVCGLLLQTKVYLFWKKLSTGQA